MNSETKTIPALPVRFSAVLKLRAIAARKIWLPRTIYTLIPFFYLLSGFAALLSALYIPGWSWFIPYALLTAGVSVHVAALIGIARYRDSAQRKYPRHPVKEQHL